MNNKENLMDEDSIDLLLLAKKLLHYWWAFLLAAIIGGGSLFGYSKFMITPLYRAECMIYVNNGSMTLNDNYYIVSQQDISASQSLVDTYMVILKSRRVLGEVASKAHVSRDYDELSDMVSAGQVNETEVFRVYVTSEDPVEAEGIANTIAEVLPEAIMEVVEGSTVKIVDKAIIPSQRISPNNKKNGLIGAAGGVCLVGALLVLKLLLDNTIQSDQDLFEITKLPLLSKIPEQENKDKKNKKYVESFERNHIGKQLPFSTQEAYRLLRTNIIYSMAYDEKGKIIGITSSAASEYKTTTAINLAIALSHVNKKVLLLDCDLRMSEIAERLKLRKDLGLTEYLTSDISIDEIVQEIKEYPNLFVGVGGSSSPNPGELLCSLKMRECFNLLKDKFDYIIVDFPPANIVSDALELAKECDGMIVVVRQEYTEKAAFQETIRKLDFLHTNTLGVVLTGVDPGKAYKKKYYKKYYGNYREK